MTHRTYMRDGEVVSVATADDDTWNALLACHAAGLISARTLEQAHVRLYGCSTNERSE